MALVEKFWTLNLRPPMKKEVPVTRSRLERTLPTSVMETMVKRPFRSAWMDRMISTTLPKVALRRPPTMSPKRDARSSVTSPSRRARGMMARKFRMKSKVWPTAGFSQR